MKPLRVVLFIQHFPPYLGGAEIQAKLLAEELARQGHQVEIATTRFRKGLDSRSTLGGAAIWRLPTVRFRWLKLPVNLLLGCVAGLRLGRRVDIFHAHCLSPFSLGGIIAAKLLRRPVLVKICSVGHQGDIARIRGFGPGSLLWRGFRCSDLFVAPTAAVAREVIENGVQADRVALIPSLFAAQAPSPGGRSRGESRRQLGLSDKTTLVYVGRLDKDKGLSALMEVWPILARERDIQLLLVGDGPMRAEIESWRTGNNVEGSVKLAGWQPDPNPWYEASDILVFPSHSESFGNVIVEAMTHGLAVASTRVGVVQDWPENVPVSVIDIARPDEFIATLATLVEDEAERLRLGTEAAEFISGRYGAALIMEKYVYQYRRLMASARPTT